jgi:nicotinamidase-related amidase
MRSSILLTLGAVLSVIAYAPIGTSKIPPSYNFTNVPFDSHTAYFFLDYIQGVIDAIPDSANKTSFLNASSTFLSAVRKLHTSNASYLPITGFSQIAFSYGYPELSPYNKAFQHLTSLNLLQPNTSGFYAGFEPQANEFPFIKRRYDASYNSEFFTLLDSHNVRRVVLSGVRTSGVIISTMRSLSDRDYVIYIVQDACLDNVDSTFLFETYFPTQAYVISLEEAISLLPKEPVDPKGQSGFNVDS